MDHKTKIFEFKGTENEFVDPENKKPVRCESKPFTFEVENLLKKRFGSDVFTKLNEGSRFEYDLNLDDVKEDFPKLLNNSEKIDLQIQEYDSLLEVYHFFLTYKRNAWLRQLKSEKQTIVSTLQGIHNLLTTIQKNTSPENS